MSNRSVGHQPAQLIGLEVVGGDQVLLVAPRREEQRGAGVVAAVGEELQREERVRRPALAQVELDGVRRPLAASAADDDEVDREPAQRAQRREPVADRLGVLGDHPGVLRRRRERRSRGSSVRWRRPAAGRGWRAARRHRWAAPGAGRSGCGSPPPRSAPRRCRRPRRTWRGRRRAASSRDSSSISRSRTITAARSSAEPAAGKPASRTTAFPAPETPSLSLTMTLSIGALGAHADDRVGHLVEGAQVLHAQRVRDADLGEQPAAAGLGAERRQPRIRAVHGDSEAQRDVALELGGVVGHEVRARPVGDQRRDPGEQVRALEQLLAQRTAATRRSPRSATAGPAHGWGSRRAAGPGSTR